MMFPRIGLDALIHSKMLKDNDGNWICSVCGYLSKKKTNTTMHVESKHVQSQGFYCPDCGVVCPNRKSLRNHQHRHHKEININFP